MSLNSPTFEAFITDKPLYYKEIDHKRVHNAYAMLKPHIQKPTAIHVVGTNGKGSTGRIMASLLYHAGYRVGHFSSPHIMKFNERIWINGEDSSDEMLESAHAILYPILGREMSEALSYFEYTTLLALVAMQDLEVIVLEAGLGGEFDATNVVEKALSVITPIGLDHQDFLGDTISSIATTKLNSIDKRAIVGFQSHPEVYAIARQIASEKGTELYLLASLIEADSQKIAAIETLTQSLGWSRFLYENTLLATQALQILDFEYDIDDLKLVKLFGRFYPILPHVRIDVGHNLLAATALVEALKQWETAEKPVLVYNSLSDKDYQKILEIFAPYIKRVEIIPIETIRAVERALLVKTLERLGIPYREFNGIEESENYLVFGSFYVVEAFLGTDGFSLT